MSARKVIYVAHPVSGDVKENIARALRWLAYLRRTDRQNTYIAPWVAALMSGEDDADPTARERGLIDCETVAARCDGIVLVGGRVSSGMAREREAVIAAGGHVFDYTRLGAEPADMRFDTSEGEGA